MVASDIISQILQRYKVLCSKYPQSPQFIPNTKGDSFYIIREKSLVYSKKNFIFAALIFSKSQ